MTSTGLSFNVRRPLGVCSPTFHSGRGFCLGILDSITAAQVTSYKKHFY